jgi:hypothetical protein
VNGHRLFWQTKATASMHALLRQCAPPSRRYGAHDGLRTCVNTRQKRGGPARLRRTNGLT